MFRYLSSFILIGLSVAMFLLFTDSLYSDIQNLKIEQSNYDQASTNSQALENERDKLTSEYSKISPENLERIKKLLPDSVDNIRLILEIEKIAQPYGMALKDVKYNANLEKEETEGGAITSGASGDDSSNRNYGSWELSFSTSANYSNFLNFMRDLENNLRIVDISSIEFSSAAATIGGSSASEVYKYTFNIKTYWLKN